MPQEPPPDPRPDPREVGKLLALAQVGFEMVVPILGGLALDHYFGWKPWGVSVGALVGLTVGFLHIVAIVNRDNRR